MHFEVNLRDVVLMVAEVQDVKECFWTCLTS